MLRVTLAGLRAHTVRLSLTGLVVVLSIGFTAGTLVLTDSLDRAGTDRVAASAAGVDLAVMSPDDPDAADGGDARLPGSVAEEVGAVDGVAACGAAAGALGLLASVVPGRRAARVAPVVALAAR